MLTRLDDESIGADSESEDCDWEVGLGDEEPIIVSAKVLHERYLKKQELAASSGIKASDVNDYHTVFFGKADIPNAPAKTEPSDVKALKK